MNARMSELHAMAGKVTHKRPILANERDWKNWVNGHRDSAVECGEPQVGAVVKFGLESGS